MDKKVNVVAQVQRLSKREIKSIKKDMAEFGDYLTYSSHGGQMSCQQWEELSTFLKAFPS